MDWLFNLTPAHWGVLGLILLIAEAFGASGFLLGTAAGALAMAVVTLLFPELSIATQLTLFAFLAIAFTVIYFIILRDSSRGSDHPLLNRRARSLVGTTFDLEQSLTAYEEAHVQLGDTRWKVTSAQSIPVGTKVRVVDAESMCLVLESVEAAADR